MQRPGIFSAGVKRAVSTPLGMTKLFGWRIPSPAMWSSRNCETAMKAVTFGIMRRIGFDALGVPEHRGGVVAPEVAEERQARLVDHRCEGDGLGAEFGEDGVWFLRGEKI